jgi:adenosylcobinamide kinase / adenosylcobinamide-phosphate guanylyltransferase
MTAGKLILIGGGVRSGKSDFALARARGLGRRRLFLATAQAGDEEMAERIRRHQRTRGDDFETVEEALALPEVLRDRAGFDVVVLDCLTLWLSNLLLADSDVAAVLKRLDDLLQVLRPRAFHALVITNEVGMGIVPETPLGRAFRDVAGLAHQRLSREADEIYLAVLGTVLRIKPGPVEPV